MDRDIGDIPYPERRNISPTLREYKHLLKEVEKFRKAQEKSDKKKAKD